MAHNRETFRTLAAHGDNSDTAIADVLKLAAFKFSVSAMTHILAVGQRAHGEFLYEKNRRL